MFSNSLYKSGPVLKNGVKANYLNQNGDYPWIMIGAEKADPVNIIQVFQAANYFDKDDIVYVTSVFTNINQDLTNICQRSVIPGTTQF